MKFDSMNTVQVRLSMATSHSRKVFSPRLTKLALVVMFAMFISWIGPIAYVRGEVSILQSHRNVRWGVNGSIRCTEPPVFECPFESTGGDSTNGPGPFQSPATTESPRVDLISTVTPLEMSGSGTLVFSGVANAYTAHVSASSSFDVDFTLDQPYEYQFVAHSFAGYPDENVSPTYSDDVRLTGIGRNEGWTFHEIRPVGLNGATVEEWAASWSGTLPSGEYSLTADFGGTLTHFSFGGSVGGTRTFDYSLKLTPVPEPGCTGIASMALLFVLWIAKHRRQPRSLA